MNIKILGLAFFVSVMAGGFSAVAQVSGTVEDGIAKLAQQIIERSNAVGRNTIAVLPFQNVDGSCSVFGIYLVDEIILNLFSTSGSNLEIIERAQLQAIIREAKIGELGLLDPKTTKELGRVSGVQALVIGTVTQLADRVRINARLIGADTGRTVSAAAATVPRTGTVIQLLEQPVQDGIICGGGQPSSRMVTATGESKDVSFSSPKKLMKEVAGTWVGVLDCGSQGWRVKFTTSNIVGYVLEGVWTYSGSGEGSSKSSMSFVTSTDDEKISVSLVSESASVYNYTGYLHANGTIKMKTNRNASCREMTLSQG